MRASVAAGIALAVCCCTAARAGAQDRWLVTEIEVGSESASASPARIIDSLARQGKRAIAAAMAQSEFERKHSQTPVRLQNAELQRIDENLRSATDALSSGEVSRVRPFLHQLSELRPEARDYLNRDGTRARRLFHICLLSGYWLTQSGQPDEGRRQGLQCLRDFPGFQPERGGYLPESVMNFFGAAARELEPPRPTTLYIDVKEHDERACHARVNGIDWGALPVAITDLRAMQLRVQVDCDEQLGRIYTLSLSPGENSFVVDPTMDVAIRSLEAVSLHYATPASAQESSLRHNLEIARAVGATHVLQVTGSQLLRIDVVAGDVTARASINDAPLDEVVGRLLLTPGQANPGDESLRTGVDDGGGSFPYATLGWVSAGGSLVGAVVALAAWRAHERTVSAYNTDSECATSVDSLHCAELLADATNAKTTIVAGTVISASFAALSLAFFLLEADRGTEREGAGRSCSPGPGDLGIECRLRF